MEDITGTYVCEIVSNQFYGYLLKNVLNVFNSYMKM